MIHVKKSWQFGFILFLVVLCLGGQVGYAKDQLASVSEIRNAVLNLVEGEPSTKQAATEFLAAQGPAAIPYYVEIMRENQEMNNLVGFELVNFAERFEEASLPVLEQGLQDSNPITRKRAARLSFALGEKAAGIVNAIALVVADQQEASDIRIQAADALRVINVVNHEVKRGLALALGGDNMLSWRINQVVERLGLTNEHLLPVLLAELCCEEDLDSTITAISRMIGNTTEPLKYLRENITKYSDEVQIALMTTIVSLYSAPNVTKDEVSQFLIEIIKNSSELVKRRTIYLLGEEVKEDPEITRILLTLLVADDFSEIVNKEIYYALEKSTSNQQAIVPLFVDLLTDPTSSAELQLIAARYLEKSKTAAYPEMMEIFEHLANYDEELLWRLSPLFYYTAMEKSDVVAKLQELTNANQPALLQEYASRILYALGELSTPLESLKIEYAAELSDKVPAFPGAEGYGRYTVGGRGGDVYVVTNLNDSGPGSLRAAVNASGPRTVVFAVSGNIMLKEPLDIANPYITIAGQTAPGEGITIAGAPVNIRTDQVIIRYLRFRMGDYYQFEADAIGGRGVSDIILDHISASWSTDECVSFYLTDNLTVQWSFITESLRGSVHVKGNHGYGGIWGGYSSFHHNLLAHHSSRNPRFDAERTLAEPATDMRNNVIYNWGFNSTYGGEGGNHNMIANYYKPGPGTGRGAVHYRILDLSNGGSWYVADNYLHGYPDITENNWAGGVQIRIGEYDQVKRAQPFDVPYVTTHSAEEAYELVLNHAGATLPFRDEIDQRIVEEVRTGTATYGGSYGAKTGIIDSQTDVGGLVFLRSHSAALDSDGDGIPDWWAIKYGFNPINGVDHSADWDGDGYTNLEEYLNGTNPLKADQH